jgi:hypothetical protein
MVFVDNKAENTDAAAALGVTTHHFTDAEGLGAFLRSLSVESTSVESTSVESASVESNEV